MHRPAHPTGIEVRAVAVSWPVDRVSTVAGSRSKGDPTGHASLRMRTLLAHRYRMNTTRDIGM
jgi:hypothetical protein